jgi:transposase-like protein
VIESSEVAMHGRRVRDEQDARDCLRAAADCQQDRAEWARENGVDPRSLNAWRINLGRASRSGPGMLELVAAVRVVRAAATYTVRCGGFAVDVGPDFDERVLARLLGVVAAC